MKLLAIVGTNSKRSTNRQLLHYIQSHFSDQADIEVAEIKDIPLFDFPSAENLPEEVLELAEKIEQADGLIFGVAEYDKSITSALMNTLAWLTHGISPVVGKPVMITGGTYGVLGSSRAQENLRQILNSPDLKAKVLPDEFLLPFSPQAFDDKGDLLDPKTVKRLEEVFEDFLLFVKITNQVVEEKKH